MKVLVVGSGGREHALAWKLAQSDSVTELISAPGSPGMAALGRTVPIAADDLEGLAGVATDERVDLTVVGPEVPLVSGIADLFIARGLKVFGPSKAAAEIEGSKVFCRELARRHGVPMAEGETFDDPGAAIDYARTLAPPIVVKAEGLAAGKGVLICRDHANATQAIDDIMRTRIFGSSGARVVVEEFLEGRETSIFCLTDGETKLILEPAQDYKRALDGDRGLNTGGMGAYSPVPWLEREVREQAVREIILPLIDGLAAEGRTYRGCFYLGAMFTAKGPRLIEVNCRFGDPETQALMPRLRSDLAEVLAACAEGRLVGTKLDWRDDACVSVVVASGGYPESYDTGLQIRGIDEAEALGDVAVFHAGTKTEDGRLCSAGGRVLNVSALGSTIPKARKRAYAAVEKMEMEGKQFRSDIAEGIS
ncbi:MAG: phosphoribosylamine--glycine ligase [Actinomycetota bacterium]